MDQPTIRIDDVHQQVNRSDGGNGESYSIPPCASLVVDAAGYRFASDAPPDLLFLATSPTAHFTLALSPSETRYVLSRETLHAVGSQAFDGFRDGTQCAIVLGAAGDGGIDAAWMGLVDVRR